jgi:hypothetical protein
VAAPLQLTRMHRVLIGVVVTGAVLIAGIGFAGSYAAVRELAIKKGFGNFAYVFPIGIDAGICVLLALDLLLTWIRIPFPLLRQTAWLLTIATVAFNAAVASDPLGMGMHAVIPVLFVVTVEAARHAVGRIADITADKHMEGVRLTRWLLSPVPTFLLWRRMKLWELRSYEQVIKLEQERLVYQARLHSRFGRGWRRKAPVESLMPLRLSRYGVPLAETAPSGLAAAGLEPVLLPSSPVQPALEAAAPPSGHRSAVGHGELAEQADAAQEPQPNEVSYEGGYEPATGPAVAAQVSGTDLVVEAPTESFDFSSAYADYVHRFREVPSARQFGLFLAEVYNLIDLSTGGPLTETELRPVLKELRQRDAAAGQWASGPSATGPDNGDAMTAPAVHAAAAAGHSLAGASASAPAPAEGAVLAPTASAANGQTTVGTVSQQAVLDLTAGGSAGVSAGNEATARLPEQQSQEQDLDPIQQQIIQVAGWLAEAEEAGERLSGSEVGRRLGVAERTGRRRLGEAEKYLSEQRRQQARANLRSVSD